MVYRELYQGQYCTFQQNKYLKPSAEKMVNRTKNGIDSASVHTRSPSRNCEGEVQNPSRDKQIAR